MKELAVPTAYLKKVSDKKNMRMSAVEKIWEKAKNIAKDRFEEEDEKYYAYTTGVFKRMMSLSKNRYSKMVLKQIPNTMDTKGFKNVLRKIDFS